MKLVFQFAQTRLGGWFIRWAFANFHVVLPITRIFENEHLLAFAHPFPLHRIHILIFPKMKVRGIETLRSKEEFLIPEIYRATRKVSTSLGNREILELVVNARGYQNIKILHFHLISKTEDRRANP